MKLYDQDPVSAESCMYVPVSSQKVFDQILRNEFAATKPLDFFTRNFQSALNNKYEGIHQVELAGAQDQLPDVWEPPRGGEHLLCGFS